MYVRTNHFYCKIVLSAAECFKDRTDVQCLHRWQKVLNPELVKGPWSKEVRHHGWPLIACQIHPPQVVNSLMFFLKILIRPSYLIS